MHLQRLGRQIGFRCAGAFGWLWVKTERKAPELKGILELEASTASLNALALPRSGSRGRCRHQSTRLSAFQLPQRFV